MLTKTYWLSFADGERPEGQQFLGVSLVEVDEDDAEDARQFLLPQSRPGAEWIMAACRKAHEMGCNPGGSVMSQEIPAEKLAEFAETPRDRLLSLSALAALGHVAM